MKVEKRKGRQDVRKINGGNMQVAVIGNGVNMEGIEPRWTAQRTKQGSTDDHGVVP